MKLPCAITQIAAYGR